MNHPQHDPLNIVPLAVAALLFAGEAARAVPGASRYYATSFGRVISCLYRTTRVLKPWRATNGYLQVSLVPDDREPGSKRAWNPLVHRLILLAFEGPPAVDPADPHAAYDVRHRDGDKGNNRLDNLAYASKAVNVRDNLRMGARYGKRPGTGLTPVAVFELRCRALVEPVPALVDEYAEAYGVGEKAVRSALRGKATWAWVPRPQDGPSPVELAEKLGVSEGEAAALLARPGSGRRAA